MEAVDPAVRTNAPGAEPSAAVLVALDPRILRLWWAAGALWVVVLTGLALGIDLLVRPPLPRGLLPGAVAVGAGLLAAGVPVLRYRRWRYAVRETDLWIRSGVLWVTTSVIPFSRLQFVDTHQGPLERLFRLSSLVVHTAAIGTSGRLPGLDTDQAERLRDRLARVEVDADGL
jgi:membrane protein YdbS with pleckstrin-like domain